MLIVQEGGCIPPEFIPPLLPLRHRSGGSVKSRYYGMGSGVLLQKRYKINSYTKTEQYAILNLSRRYPLWIGIMLDHIR